MDNPHIAKAVLIPLEGNRPSSDDSKYILVQFNPASLRVTLSNSLKADTQGGSSSAAAQYVEKSESTLAVSLLFDTTVAFTAKESIDVLERNDQGTVTATRKAGVNATHQANSDVRLETKRIAAAFMQPQDPHSSNPRAPQRCRFQWGSFSFDGMLASYNETLDFFSPEGIPLRATLQLSFKEQRFQFDTQNVTAAARAQPTLTPGGPELSAATANALQGKDPKQWRDTALFNGMENPRLSTSAGLSVPGVSLGLSAGIGISGGVSAGFTTGISGGISAGVGAATGLQAGAGLSSSAQLGFTVGASAKVGTDIPGAFVQIKTK